jgi:hypothetical protein
MLINHLRSLEINPFDRAEVRCGLDPRVGELERLRLSLASAATHIDEFEMRLKRTIRAELRNPTPTENSLADHVAACMKKVRLPEGELRP